MFQLALASLWNRRTIAALTVLSIAFSVALVLSVEKLRRDARSSFANTVSGVDLIVGARSGSVQLLLYSVFRIGNATNNISWESYQAFKRDRNVAWTVPFSLGDSHRGYRVLGTDAGYFEHLRYGSRQALALSEGEIFAGPLEAVIGAEVAKRLGYSLGEAIVLSHGAGDVSFIDHRDKPFSVVGILEQTGTPIDRTVHVSLQGIESIHEGWESGAPRPKKLSLEQSKHSHEPAVITAFLVGLKSRMAVFSVQRRINEYNEEPLLAILPGVALQELWDVMRLAEDALRLVAAMVVMAGLLGMLVVILASLEARRREMAILRSVGAGPRHIFALLVFEAGVLSASGALVGLVLHLAAVLIVQPFSQAVLGINISITWPTLGDALILALIVVGGLAAGLLPAIRAYRMSLSDGLSLRI